MEIFNLLSTNSHEQVVFCYNKTVNLKAIIAIHDTTLGPALGGCRMLPYKTEQDALDDVLRLSKGMTYKAAVSGLNLGGGKTVVIGDPRRDKTEPLLRMLGRFINTLGGRYITAEDVGTNVADMLIIRQETEFITGVPTSRGGGGDPSIITAYGVLKGIEACLLERYGSRSVKGKVVAIQGIGSVGYHLAENIANADGKLILSDINEKKLKEVADKFGASAVSPADIYSQKCNIFAPCALGGIINSEMIPQLQCDIIAGSANNQLKNDKDADELRRRGILYAPDFVINAGGLINVAEEIYGYNRQSALENAAKIFDSVKKVLAISKEDNISTDRAAQVLAETRIEQIRSMKNIYN